MAYKYINAKGNNYYLHSRVVGKNGAKIYFFAKNVKEESSEDALPDEYMIVENDRTGLPTLKRKEEKSK